MNRRKVKWNRAGTCDRNARIELALVLSPKDETARICARLLSHLGEKSLLLQSCLSISRQQFWKDILKILYVQKCRCNYNSCNLRDALRRLCKALMAQLQDVALLACCQLQPVCLQATRHPKLRAENIQSFQTISRHFMSFHVISCHFMSFHVISEVLVGFSSFVLCKTTTLTSVQRNKDESRICCISIPHNLQVPTFLCHHAVQRFGRYVNLKVTASWKQFYGELPCDSVLPRSVAAAWACS